MAGKGRKATKPQPDNDDTYNNTPQEATDMTTAVPEIQITTGVSAPTRTRNGAGRQRQETPFDDVFPGLYESGEWAQVPFDGEEQEKQLRNMLKNTAQHLGYGLDLGVDAEVPGVLKFHVRDKVEGRGRKPGTKKIGNKFYSPDQLDADGNPLESATDEASTDSE